MAMSPLTLGITFNQGEATTQLLGGSGLNQNVIFLYELLDSLGHDVYMITDEREDDFLRLEGKIYKVRSATEIIEQQTHFDVVFEAGLTLIQRDRFFLRERCGSRIVCVRYGNSLFLDMEGLFVKNELSSNCHVGKPEMVWISPHFEKSVYYIEALYQSQVDFAPFIWEPNFVNRRFANNDYSDASNVVVMEPNISVLKNALIPLVILNEVCRENPNIFQLATVLNGMHYCNAPYFLSNFVQNLSYLSSEQNKVFFSGRYRIFDVFDKPHVLLGCQHYNGLNYLYMEALYMGLPLVHNSTYYLDVGFYYPEFDVRVGKKQLIKALKQYQPEHSRIQNDKFLYRFSINNPIVRNRYQVLLDRVMSIPIITSV